MTAVLTLPRSMLPRRERASQTPKTGPLAPDLRRRPVSLSSPEEKCSSPGGQGNTLVVEQRLHELFMAGLDGSKTDYETFLDTIAGHLRAYFRRHLSGQADRSEDLVQEVLIAVHTKKHTYDTSRPVSAWVYGIAKFKLADHFRTLGRNAHVTNMGDESDLLADTQADTARDHQLDLATLLTRLPDKQRRAIRLVKLEGLSVREAADKTALSEADIRVSIHRGLKSLISFVRQGG